MSELSCKDCLHYFNNRVCMCRHIELPAECNICPFFSDKNGHRPRFCRLASSVDEMASAMVWDSGGGRMNTQELLDFLYLELMKKRESVRTIAKAIGWNYHTVMRHLKPTECNYVKKYDINLINDIAKHLGFELT